MKRLVRTLFPIHNWGLAAVFAVFAFLVAFIALFGDPVLALYVGIGGYVGMVVNMARLGLAPDEMVISARDIAPLEAKLNASPFVVSVGPRVWAPKSYQSWWWESDRISIVEAPGGAYLLKARRRDLKVLRKVLGR